MFDSIKIEFKGDHFMIDKEKRVEILNQEQFDKLERDNNYIKDHNYVQLGHWVQPNEPKDGKAKYYVIVALGVSGSIYALPPREVSLGVNFK